jgi:hypothetical protein
MAGYKNQHFVPKCYLKRFSAGYEGRAINVYNLNRQMAIQNASVKDQCSGNYFYGKDLRLEKLLSEEEALYDRIVMQVIGGNARFKQGYGEHLKRFAYLQFCRTESASWRFTLAMQDMLSVGGKLNDNVDWKEFKQQCVLDLVSAFVDTIDPTSDLSICIVRNQTHAPFIASDDPSVLTNRLYAQNRVAKGMTSGIASAGAILLLPISPQCLVVIYGGDVYYLPNNLGFTTLRNSDDQLQIWNCSTNIYFSEWGDRDYLTKQIALCIASKPANRHRVNTAVLDRVEEAGKKYRAVSKAELNGHSEILLHVEYLSPFPARWPSIIQWSVRRKAFYNGSGAGLLRRAQVLPDQGFRNIFQRS